MSRLLIILFFILSTFPAISQEAKPKLVVGIVIDQMRYEYLNRFGSRFSETGFKKLMNDGFSFKNTHYNYIPTYTGPGHAAVYTGATPAVNGIIGNNWYDKIGNKTIYCAGDSEYNTVGSDTNHGKMSPKNLLTTTITDQLRLSTQMRSKVIGISIKDRGAIFPAGHTGDAYWYDRDEGKLITSSYYKEELPEWVADFNKKKRSDYYIKQTWDTKFDIDTYVNSGPDEKSYESKLGDKTTFPYNLKKIKADLSKLASTPFGNDYLAEAAISAIEDTDLGEDADTDFLLVSFSATDYIGHAFGPNSIEVEDTYLRLDDNISQILKSLDKKLGVNNYTVFITADHAVAEIPQRLQEEKVPAGHFERVAEELNNAAKEKFGSSALIINMSNEQVFINHAMVKARNLNLAEIQEFIKGFMLDQNGVMYCYTSAQIEALDYTAGGIIGNLRRGFNQKRSGDILYVLNPAWINGDENSTGTTHGSGYSYDTHVPLLWYGAGVKQGSSYRKHAITQIAPTLSMMLQITLPNGAMDEPLYELFE